MQTGVIVPALIIRAANPFFRNGIKYAEDYFVSELTIAPIKKHTINLTG